MTSPENGYLRSHITGVRLIGYDIKLSLFVDERLYDYIAAKPGKIFISPELKLAIQVDCSGLGFGYSPGSPHDTLLLTSDCRNKKIKIDAGFPGFTALYPEFYRILDLLRKIRTSYDEYLANNSVDPELDELEFI